MCVCMYVLYVEVILLRALLACSSQSEKTLIEGLRAIRCQLSPELQHRRNIT